MKIKTALNTGSGTRKKSKAWYQQESFLEERQRWYAKLKKAGFNDIEYHDQKTGQSLPVLRGFSLMDAKRYFRPDAAEYYRLAEHHIRNCKRIYGAKSWESAAWEMHASGMGTKRIAEALNRKLSQVIRLIRIEKESMLDSQKVDDVEGAT